MLFNKQNAFCRAKKYYLKIGRPNPNKTSISKNSNIFLIERDSHLCIWWHFMWCWQDLPKKITNSKHPLKISGTIIENILIWTYTLMSSLRNYVLLISFLAWYILVKTIQCTPFQTTLYINSISHSVFATIILEFSQRRVWLSNQM